MKNPFSKKKTYPGLGSPSKPKVKKDYFNAMVILLIGLMIGALIVYILVTNSTG